MLQVQVPYSVSIYVHLAKNVPTKYKGPIADIKMPEGLFLISKSIILISMFNEQVTEGSMDTHTPSAMIQW